MLNIEDLLRRVLGCALDLDCPVVTGLLQALRQGLALEASRLAHDHGVYLRQRQSQLYTVLRDHLLNAA